MVKIIIMLEYNVSNVMNTNLVKIIIIMLEILNVMNTKLVIIIIIMYRNFECDEY